MSNKFTYFGDLSTDEYKEKYPAIKAKIKNLKQGHRVNHEVETFDELSSLINENITKNINGNPIDDDSCKSCGDIEGELVPCFKSAC